LGYKGKEKVDEEGDCLIWINGFKPKKEKKKKKRKRKRPFLPKGLKPSLGVGLKGLGPSPGIDFKGIESSRGSLVLRTCLVGETSLVGVLSSAGVLGMALLSILGSYEWVCKDTMTEVKSGYLGSSPSAVCELMEGRLGSDD
jgi:hypothetical protein